MRPCIGHAGVCANRWLMAPVTAGAMCKVVVVLVLVLAVAGQQAPSVGAQTVKGQLRAAWPPPFNRRAFPPPPPPPPAAANSTVGSAGSKPLSTSPIVDPTAKLKEAASILRMQLAASDTSGLATFAQTALTPQAAESIFDSLPKRESSSPSTAMMVPSSDKRVAAAATKPGSMVLNAQDAPKAAAAAADVPTMLGPVSDTEVPYNYATGLEAVAQLLRTNASSEVAQLVKGMDNLGWLVRSYDIAGDPLLRIRINQDMEQLVQSAVAESISSLAGIPSNQVLLFASANVTQVLSVKGVNWAAGGGQAAVQAMEKALAMVGGGFDAGYVDVAVGAAAATPTPPSNSSSAVGRKLQQAAAAAAPPIAAGGAQTVRVTYYGMAPNNASSLLTELEAACLTGLAPNQPLAGECQAALVQQLQAAGVLQNVAGFQATPVSKPQVSLDVAIAVGLNNTQASSGAGQLSATFLNSTALADILRDFNLSARPTDWMDTFLGPNRTAAPFWRIPGLLTSPSPSPPVKPSPSRSPPPPEDVEDVSGPPSKRDKGFYAAIAVAITVATAALIGLIVVIIKRRPGAAAQREQKGLEMTSSAAAGGGGQRRRRARPRVYNSKYLPTVHVDAGPGGHGAGSSGASSSNGAGSSSSIAAAAAASAASALAASALGAGSGHVEVDLPPPVALQRHDSVMSAVRGEMEDEMGALVGRGSSSEAGSSQGSEAGSLPQTPSAPGSRAGTARQHGRGSTSSSAYGEAGYTGGSSSSSWRPRTRSAEAEGGPSHNSGTSSSSTAVDMGHMTHGLLPPVGAWQYNTLPGPVLPMGPLTPYGAVLPTADGAAAGGLVHPWAADAHMAALMGHAMQQQQQQQQQQPPAGVMSYWGSSVADSSDLDLVSQRLTRVPTGGPHGVTGGGGQGSAQRSASAGTPGAAVPPQQQQQQQVPMVGNLIARASSLVLERKASCNQLAAAAPLAVVGQPGHVLGSGIAVAAGQHYVNSSRSSSSGGVHHPCEQPFSPPPVHFAPPAAAAALPIPGTPPATPVTPLAAAFEMMSQQLGGSSSSRGQGAGPSLEEVQPLGASCWHAGGHTSGFKLEPAEATQHAVPAAAAGGVPGADGGIKPAPPAFVSPFAAMAAGFGDDE